MDPMINTAHSQGAKAFLAGGGVYHPPLLKGKGSLSKGWGPLKPKPRLSGSETPWLVLFSSATLPLASATASFPPFNLNKTEWLFFFFFPLAGIVQSCNISPLGSLGSHDTVFTHRPDYHHRALFLFPSKRLELGRAHTWGACHLKAHKRLLIKHRGRKSETKPEEQQGWGVPVPHGPSLPQDEHVGAKPSSPGHLPVPRGP